MNKTKQLTEGALLTAIFVGLLLVYVYVPVLSFFAAFVLAIPYVIFAAKYDWKPSIIMLIVSILFSFVFATIVSIPIPIVAGLGGIMIGSAIYRESTPYETWARGTLGFVAGLLFVPLFMIGILNVNVIEVFHTQIDEALNISKLMIAEIGIGELSDEQFGLIEQQINLYKQLVPVFIVIASIVMALITQWISYKLLNRTLHKQLRFPKFRNLRFPIAVIWIYLLAILGTLFVQNDPNGGISVALQNIIMLTGLLMVIQGFSFIFFFTHHKKISLAIPILTIVLTFLFAPLLLPLVRILGIIDLGFGLRDRLVK